MTLLKDNNFKDINIALLSLENDIKNKTINFDNSAINKQFDDINKRIDEINAGSNNSAEINEIRMNIDDINNDISNIDNKVFDINTNLSGISAEIENINTDVDNIELKLSNIFSAENFVEDFNTTTQSGIYYWSDSSLNSPSAYGVLLVNKYEKDNIIYINQTAYGTDGRIYFRQKTNDNEWTSWQTIAYTTDTVERAKGWDIHSLDLSELSTDNFYPVVIETKRNFLEVAIHSPQGAGTNIYSQNRIKFSISAQGWADTPVSIFISEYTRFDDQETTIGSIGRTTSSFAGIVIWLRGGLTYTCYTMNSIAAPYIITEDTFLPGSTRVTVGPDYSGGYNYEVDILFTPDTTMSEGSYFSRGLTSTNTNVSNNLTLKNTTDVKLDTFGQEALSIGTATGENLGFDTNEIQARNNGETAPLYINDNGGMVNINAVGSSDGGLKVRGKMIIPIGQPSVLEDGCIWIER